MLDDRRAVRAGDRAGPRWANGVTGFVQRVPLSPDELTGAVAAHSRGSGPDVVLVPGLAVSNYLRRIQEHLATTARVHLLDLPGVGAADDLRRSPTLREDAAAVTGWLRRHLRAPAVVVGHSYGTQVVARAAAADGDPVRGVVLASPTIDPAVRSARSMLRRWRWDTATQPPGLADVNRPQQRRAGPGRLLTTVVSMLADDIGHWLVQVDAPVTVLVGTEDAYCTAAWGRSLADRVDGAFRSVAGGTHTFPFDRPEELVTAVRHM